LISNDNFWLSETPFEPSIHPGAGYHRLCTIARFRLVSNPSQTFTVFNTHLDHYSDKSRRVAASLLLTRARFEAVNTAAPIFILGDFNSPPTGSDSGGYKITTGASPPLPINLEFAKKYSVTQDQMPDFRMLDLRAETPQRNVSANFATYTGFGGPSDTSDWSRIDFIFGGSNKGWTSNSYMVRSVLSDDGMLASDHRPVFADISFLPAP
jgi:endonuclease/exonuclease/phosphatase family metal-dependent hydrolase